MILSNSFYGEGKFITTSFERFQIIPTFGYFYNCYFSDKLIITFKYGFSIGFKPYQTIDFEYSIDNTPQPPGKVESNGSGHNVIIGIGYIFKN